MNFILLLRETKKMQSRIDMWRYVTYDS